MTNDLNQQFSDDDFSDDDFLDLIEDMERVNRKQESNMITMAFRSLRQLKGQPLHTADDNPIIAATQRSDARLFAKHFRDCRAKGGGSSISEKATIDLLAILLDCLYYKGEDFHALSAKLQATIDAPQEDELA